MNMLKAQFLSDKSFPSLGTKRTYAQFTNRSFEKVESKQISDKSTDMEDLAQTELLSERQECQQYKDAVLLLDQTLKDDERYIDTEELQLLTNQFHSYEQTESPLKKIREIPVPRTIKGHIQSVGTNLLNKLSGIWNELYCVYIVINNRLYMWNYVSQDLVSFEPMKDVIEAIGLGKLNSDGGYDLWIASDRKIALFHLFVKPTVKLIPTAYSLSISKPVKIIYGDERVFYGDDEGHLCEVAHEEYTGCFSRSSKLIKKDYTSTWLSTLVPALFGCNTNFIITKITIDKSRNLLYTLSQNNTRINVYTLNNLSKLTTITIDKILRQVKNYDRDEIENVIPIEKSNSSNIHLIIILKSGIRFYLSFIMGKKEYTGKYVISNVMASNLIEGEVLDKVYYSKGSKYTLMAVKSENGVKLLHTGINESAIATIRQEAKSSYTSCATVSVVEQRISGSVMDIKEECKVKFTKMLNVDQDNSEVCPFSCLLPSAQYVYVPFVEIYVLTTESLIVYGNNRAIDKLHLIVSHFPLDIYAVNSFAKVYGRVETAAMLLHIACCPEDVYFTRLKKQTITSQIMKAATKAFFEMNIEDIYTSKTIIGYNMLTLPKADMRSIRVSSLYRYISRIIRPIWARYIVKAEQINESEEVVQMPLCNFQERKLIQQKLAAVKVFIEQNFDAFFVYSKLQMDNHGDVFNNDKHELTSIQKLLTRILEGLEFLSIMDNTELFYSSLENLSSEDIRKLSTIIFKELPGKQVPETFIISLLFSYLTVKKEKVGVIEIMNTANTWHSMFPEYFTNSHLHIYQAINLLERALTYIDRSTQAPLIQKAEGLIFRNVNYVNIHTIMPLLISLQQYSIATRLCILLAESNNIWTSLSHKNEYYMVIIKLLDEFLSSTDNKEQMQVIGLIIKEAIRQTNDPTLHTQIFQWLSQRQLNEVLIKLESPYLDQFIARKSEVIPVAADNTLYRYLIEKKRFKEASQLLYETAVQSNELVHIEDRMQYLNMALQVLSEVNDNPEVIDIRSGIELCKESLQLQSKVLNHMKEREVDRINVEMLESSFVPTQVLYDNYVKKYDLWDIGIQLIMHSTKSNEGNTKYIYELNTNYENLIKSIYLKDRQNWPFEIQKKLRELAMKSCLPNTPEAFPIDIILHTVEIINSEQFDIESFDDTSLPMLINRTEYWFISFLRSNPLRLE